MGLSNQVFPFLSSLLFGLTSGMSIFTAQFLGKQESRSHPQSIGYEHTVSTLIALSFPCGHAHAANRSRLLHKRRRSDRDRHTPFAHRRVFIHPCCACHLLHCHPAQYSVSKITVIATTTALIFKTIFSATC
ncbi:MAG: hypothetical protein IPP54_20915 [Anaerolineales bacterium]|nr:hypothetical protein [Anaerolineales bacterium]